MGPCVLVAKWRERCLVRLETMPLYSDRYLSEIALGISLFVMWNTNVNPRAYADWEDACAGGSYVHMHGYCKILWGISNHIGLFPATTDNKLRPPPVNMLDPCHNGQNAGQLLLDTDTLWYCYSTVNSWCLWCWPIALPDHARTLVGYLGSNPWPDMVFFSSSSW